MEELVTILKAYREVEETKENLEQFSKAIIDLVRKNTVGFEKVAKKKDKKEYKPTKELPEGFLNYIKTKELKVLITLKDDDSQIKGKILGFNNYTLMIEEEYSTIKNEIKYNLIWLPKHSIKYMTEMKNTKNL